MVVGGSRDQHWYVPCRSDELGGTGRTDPADGRALQRPDLVGLAMHRGAGLSKPS